MRGITLAAVSLGILIALGRSSEHSAAQVDSGEKQTQSPYQDDVLPLLKKYCFQCHSGELTEADVDLAAFPTLKAIQQDTRTWVKVRRILDSGQMPPPDSPQPSDDERKLLQSWVNDFLKQEAKAHAGDPGPVVLRRLSNDEYAYTIRDLTGVPTLSPAKEFPEDAAAGEGFTNTGSGQGMSPALIQKYLEAGKQVAEHAVLGPEGMTFSPFTTRADHTNELLAEIQSLYRRYSADGGGSAVNLQGIQFNTNQGGVLPLQRYIAATLEERDAFRNGTKTVTQVATERGLSEKYLGLLWETLSPKSAQIDSPLLNVLRTRWHAASPQDGAAITAEIEQLQKSLWKFNSIGHVGRTGGPKSWMEPLTPTTTRQDVRVKLPAAADGKDLVLYLSARELGGGPSKQSVVWEKPRLIFPDDRNHPPILFSQLPTLTKQVESTLAAELPQTSRYLDAVLKAKSSSQPLSKIAADHRLNPQLLERWSHLMDLKSQTRREVTGHFPQKLLKVHGYEAVNGWGLQGTPSLITNRSDEAIKFLTLTVPGRGVTVHPSPTLEAVVSWQSPVSGSFQLTGLVADADGVCGNGVAWKVELLNQSGTSILAQGEFDNGGKQTIARSDAIEIQQGDIVSLVVNPRAKNHACDTTHIELKLSETSGKKRSWDLAGDIVDRVLQSNPLPDSYGHPQVWHFGSRGEPTNKESKIPVNSALDAWRTAAMKSEPAVETQRLAKTVEKILAATDAESLSASNQALYRELRDWTGPLRWATLPRTEPEDNTLKFGRHPDGIPIDADSLCVSATGVTELRIPHQLAVGAEFLTAATLHPSPNGSGGVSVNVATAKPEQATTSLPVLVSANPSAQQRVIESMAEFRNLFPAALCYARIVPVDEVVTLTLYHREDTHLQRLMLTKEETKELNRLWNRLYFVSREPEKLVVAFTQLSEFATQDRPDLVTAFEPLRKPINQRNIAFQQQLLDTEPIHLQAVLDFADRAWRRSLSEREQEQLRAMYRQFRSADISHEEAIRLLLARVLTSPAFLFKLEHPAPGHRSTPVTNPELATRLSYFLTSSLPDPELRAASDANRLTDDEELLAQTHRLLKSTHARRLAIQFACQWLHLRNFDQHTEKNETLYPEFVTLNEEMNEETILFFEELFRNDRSILTLLDANHTFLNETLAKHYGIEGVSGEHWRRVEGVKQQGRGGVLGMSSFLASQSGVSRTSPILRGNWVYETLLGERLPRPPANVPQLPEQVPTGLTARQLIEQHSSVAECAKCHAKIDPFGFALEQYDTIGRLRDRNVDTHTRLPSGRELEGLAGLREYLLKDRREDVVRQFTRKLLGYALGREVQLSDEPLLDEISTKLKANEYRVSVAMEAIVLSPQFRQIRGETTMP